MSNSIVKITRKELYEKVWSEPVTKLAKQYGFSDVWLAKICRKHNIPRPPRGYWARKKSGAKIPRTPLPPKKEESIIKISTNPFKVNERNVPEKRRIPEKRAIPNIAVPESLIDPHPFVAKSSEILSSCKLADTGILNPPANARCLNIRVSRDSLSRALRIMDTLIKTLDAMGFEVSISEHMTKVYIFDVLVSFCLGEELYKKHLEAKAHNLDGYYQFGYNLYEKNPIPAGRLFLSIEEKGLYYAWDYRRYWRDTETRKLEDILKGFISGLMKAANLKKAKRSETHEQP